RSLRQHLIQLSESELEFGCIDADDLEPQGVIGRLAGKTGCNLRPESFGRHYSIMQVAFAEILSALRRVSMRVDDARQDNATLKIDKVGFGPCEGAYILIAAKGDNGISADGERLHDAAVGIYSMYPTMEQYDVGGSLRGRRKVGRQNRVGRQQQQCPQRPPLHDVTFSLPRHPTHGATID